jgi:AraC family L-rhamnose operon transcriptional activator RhaR
MLLLIKHFAGYRTDGEVWVQRSSHGQHNLLEEHGHDFIEMVYVVHGKGRHRINGDDCDIHPGDMFVIIPGEGHYFPDVTELGLEIVNCLFMEDSIRRFMPADPGRLTELPYVLPFYEPDQRMPRQLSLTSEESTAILAQLELMIREMKESGPGSTLILRNLLIDLLIRLSRIHLLQDKPERAIKPLTVGHEILVRKVIAHLELNFHQKITVDDLARMFTISPRHLNRVFRQESGKTILAVLQHIRIERAKHMLAETNRSIDGIASAVGFGDPSFFNRLFSRNVGCTPSAYRKQIKPRHISQNK